MSYERNFITIESAHNERLKSAVKLLASNHALRQSGLAAAEGLHLAETLLHLPGVNIESVWIPQSLLNKPEWLTMSALSDVLENGEVQCMVLSDALYSKLSKLKTPTGPMIFFKPVDASESIDLTHDVALLDGIQDPGNVGTMLRNCAAAGLQQVALSDHSAWVWSEKVLRAGMGAQFSLQIYSESDLLAALSQQNVQAIIRVTSLHPKSVDLFNADLKPAGIWVFGSEGQGVSQPWLDRASQHIRIPQSKHIESLNVGSSSAVCLFEQLRQRR
jgi:RNA methyltransferase, TrmH family